MSYFEGNSPFGSLKNDVQPILESNEKVHFIKMGNYISNLYTQSTGPLSFELDNAKSKAHNLIELIKKEYHLE